MDRRVQVVDAAVRFLWRLRCEDVGPVGVHAGDGPAEDFLHVVAFLSREAQTVIACGEGAGDELIREGLHRVPESRVGDVVLVQLQLVQVDELSIKRVEQLRLEGQGLQIDVPVPDLALDPVPEAAVQEAQLPGRVVLGHKAEALEVVDQPVEALHALLKGSGDRLRLGAAFAVPESERGLQAFAEGGLDGLPRGEDVGLGKAPHVRALHVEARDVIDLEEMPGHQLQRLAPEGSAVHALALGEAEEARHDLDAELRQRRPEVPAIAAEVIQEASRTEPLQLFDPAVRLSPFGILDHRGQVWSRGEPGPRHPMSSWTACRRSSSICSLIAAASSAVEIPEKGSAALS